MTFDIDFIFVIVVVLLLFYIYITEAKISFLRYNPDEVINIDFGNIEIKNSVEFSPKPEYIREKFTSDNGNDFKRPEILLEGLDNNIPNKDILNDRYSTTSRQFTDDELINLMPEIQPITSDYSQNIIDKMGKTKLIDMDSKILEKNQKNQQLFKDSKTISANFGKNSLIESYKDEINYYSATKTPWWE